MELDDMKMEQEETDKSLAKTFETDSLVQLCFEHSAGAILIVDQQGIVRLLNPATENLFNKRAKHMLGKRFGFPISMDKPQDK